MSENVGRFCAGLLVMGCLLATSLPTATTSAQPYGLDAPEPVGPFLDGVFPTRTPQAPGSSTWQVVDAFNVSVPNTLVVEPNPSDGRLYIGSRGGSIVSIENDENLAQQPEAFMDLTDRVAVVWDGGFLGLAFHPEFGVNGSPHETTFYAYYSSYCPTKLEASRYVVDFANCNPSYPQGSTGGFFNTWLRLSRFQAYWDANLGAWRGDRDSEEPLFNIRLYNGSHRGGGPVIGNDGKLYVAIGDQFRYDTAQDIVGNFEGGSMRLEVDVTDNGDGTWSCPAGSHQPLRFMQDVTGNADEMTGHQYCVPDDNPWPGWSGENFGEYNSVGHRNPHRIALDPVTGLLWSGEVGQSTREEINVIVTGRNYQWPYMEGLTTGVRAKPSVVIGQEQPPVIDFVRSEARTIIGGYVYRGTRFPELSGRYIAGDYSTNNIWAITLDINTMTATKDLLTTFPSQALGTFGQDHNGEIFMGDVFANIPLQRLDRIGTPVPDPPALLSQTGAFQDTASFTVSDAAVPYDIVPFWSDGALKQRWLFLPNDGTHDAAGEQITFSANSNWAFPTGTVAMKHFELALDESNPTVGTRLETRFLVLGDDGDVYGVTYRWRPDQTDADLLSVAEVADYTIQLEGGGTRVQTWLYPSRAECMQCHTDGAAGFLGLRTHQLNRDITYPSTGRSDNQLRTWNSLGMFTAPLLEGDIDSYPRASRLDDPTASLEEKARSWLDSNCSNCHRPETGNRAAFDARFTTPLASQGMVWGGVIDDLGVAEPYLISPGDPSSSVIRIRTAAAAGSNVAMPPLAKQLADNEALALLDEWILRVSPNYARTGLLYEYYEEAGLSVLPDFDSLTPVATGTIPTFDLSVRQRNDDFAFRFTGLIEIPDAGAWTFYTSSDDGSQLFIDGALVVDNDGLHANQEQSGVVTLAAGSHDIVVTMFERGGSEVLTVSWEGPAQTKEQIPVGSLYQEPPGSISNAPPSLLSPGPQTSEEGASVSLALQGGDPDGDLLLYAASGLPTGLTLDPLSGEVLGTVASGQLGTTSVVASASDGPDVAVVTFDWSIVPPSGNPPPVVTGVADQVDHEGDSVQLVVTATDADPLTFTATGLPPNLSIDPDTGEITGVLAVGSGGFYDTTVFVTDGTSTVSTSFLWSVVAPNTTGILSDDFHTGALNPTLWAIVDPQGDGTVSLVGAGTPDAHMLLAVPAGTPHDPWKTNTSLRVMQPAADVDFELEVKFESEPTQRYQGQGLLVEQDASNYIRLDVFHDGNGFRVFSATIDDGSPTVRLNNAISAMPTTYLRLTRGGNQWTAHYSPDGASWTTAGSFSAPLAVSAVGVFASNFKPNPAYTAVVDYFFETSAPILLEDPPLCDPSDPLVLSTQSTFGTILRSPDLASYSCGDVVTLTAQPDPGATFLGWGGALSGVDNPSSVTMLADSTVTASFQPDVTPPQVSGLVAIPGETTASIAWTTDEVSTAFVEYGPTTAYESGLMASVAPGTGHSVALMGLDPSSVYHYRVTVEDLYGNTATTGDGTFTTEDPPACLPTELFVLTTTSTNGTITRTPDQASYACGDVVILSAVPDTNATFEGWGGALSGTTSPIGITMEQDATVTASFQLDSTPPSVGSVMVVAGQTSASVSWVTDEVTIGSVEYGPTTAYESGLVVSTTPHTAHTVVLGPLTAGTLYHFRVTAEDGAGHLTTTPDDMFTTNADLWAAYSFAGAGSTVTDASGNGNHGALTGGASIVPSGQFDDAVELTGGAGAVDLGGIDIVGDQLTIAAWVNADDFGISDARIVSKSTGSAANDHLWMLSTISGQRLRFRLKTDDGNSTTTLIGTGGNLNAGTWHFVAATYDGATIRLFIDGTEVGSAPKTGIIGVDPGIDAWIGNNPGTGNQGFDGRIDELRIFTRALGASELLSLATTSVESPTPDTTPPTTPGLLTAVATGATTIDLSWAASTDDRFVASYVVARDGINIATLPSSQLTFSDNGLDPGLTYGYTVVALDSAGNMSAPAGPVTETTFPPDVDPPSVPGSFTGNATSFSTVVLSWVESSDNVAVGSYLVTRDGVDIASVSAPATGYIDVTATPDTTHVYYVTAVDTSGNVATAGPVAVLTPPAPDVPDDLWAAYSFDGAGSTVTDVSGNGNHGALTGGASIVPSGQFDDAVELTGGAGAVDLGGIDIVGDQLTIAAWVNADDFGINDARIVSKSTSSAANDHLWMLSTISGQRLRFRLKTDDGNSTTTLIGTGGNLTAGTWHFVAATYDGATMRLFIDGTEVGSAPKTGTIGVDPGIDAWIGNNPGTGNQGFDGRIDELRIFTRALSPGELLSLALVPTI